MRFGDLKNDFVFRRIFASKPDILCGLLNDLLERSAEQTIESIEYLPSEHLPLVPGFKLSILDVRCKDRSGATFVVEMQLVHVAGFDKRVVYNGCKAYVGQLKAGDPYTNLTDVVAISICDFVLWPDDELIAKGLTPVPMLSRWNMRERHSHNHGLLQVQYAFLELPKLSNAPPKTGAEIWAWLFVHGHELREIPESLPQGPYRQALDMANQATFTEEEFDAYRKVTDEIEQLKVLLDYKWNSGLIEGEARGEMKAKRETLLRLLLRSGIETADEQLVRIRNCADVATLDRWTDNVINAKTMADVFA